jgi:hypothetical protein
MIRILLAWMIDELNSNNLEKAARIQRVLRRLRNERWN